MLRHLVIACSNYTCRPIPSRLIELSNIQMFLLKAQGLDTQSGEKWPEKCYDQAKRSLRCGLLANWIVICMWACRDLGHSMRLPGQHSLSHLAYAYSTCACRQRPLNRCVSSNIAKVLQREQDSDIQFAEKLQCTWHWPSLPRCEGCRNGV